MSSSIQNIVNVTAQDGTPVRGYEVEFKAKSNELWNEYIFDDGTTARIKNVLVRAYRVVDEQNNPAFDGNGEPFIIVKHTVIVSSRKGDTLEYIDWI